LESQSFDNRVFIHRKTGEIVNMLAEFLTQAEDGEEPDESIPEWHKEMLTLANEIIENEHMYKPLPEFEIDEYRMMERFCFTVRDSEKEAALLDAIQGSGAFRRFKDLVHRFEIVDDWYDYREEGYKQIARDFCERHEFDYTE